MKKLLMFLSIVAVSCSSGKDFKKSPVDVLIRDMDKTESFSIILYDMDVTGTFVRTYQHQYKVVTLNKDTPEEKITDWMEVSEEFFRMNENNMGMEIAAKSADGKITKTASPPGYSNYVGNAQYGQWRDNGSGGSFWEFYGKYAMMSTMFNMMASPINRGYYNDYRSNYYGRQAYYGPKSSDGSTTYGTQSAFARKTSGNSRWTARTASRSSASSSSSWSSRTSRSSSRYTGSSGGFRSRGGGFGK